MNMQQDNQKFHEQSLEALHAHIELALIITDSLKIAEVKPNFSEKTLIAATNLYTDIIADKIMDLKIKEKMNKEDGIKMSRQFAKEFSNLIKKYTDIQLSVVAKKSKNTQK